LLQQLWRLQQLQGCVISIDLFHRQQSLLQQRVHISSPKLC
jgi:hypothetical protein